MSLFRGLMIAVLSLGMFQVVHAEDAPPASQQAKTQPVDFRKLKELMPEKLADLKRSKNDGQKTAIGDFVISQATGTFGPEEPKETDPTITVEITDYSANTGMAELMAAWQNIQMDNEGDSGFERTTRIADQPAHEQYQNEGKSGQIQVFVAKKYLVNVTTTNLSADQVKKLGESLPIKKLAELKS